MAESNNNNTFNLDDLVGRVIDGEVLETLITNGRVKFPFKDVRTPSAVSNAGEGDPIDGSPTDNDSDEAQLLGLLDSVKENEDLIKTLEDMRDDMLSGMNIPPANKSIADAAKALGSPDGNITKPVFETAQAITDPTYQQIKNTGFVPQIAAITGVGNVDVPDTDCQDVSKAIFDSIDLTKLNDLHTRGPQSVNQDIADQEEQFANKMQSMFKYLINELFWNWIWTRMWVSIFDMTENLVAKPIDFPIMILMSLFIRPVSPRYNLSQESAYKWGPVHKVLNKLKLLFLCKIPHAAWPDYKPDPDVQVYVAPKSPLGKKHGVPSTGIVAVADICSRDISDPDCAAELEKPNDFEDTDYTLEDDDDAFKDFGDTVGNKLNAALDSNCPKTALQKLFGDIDSGENPHKCADAAKKVIEAVYNDAIFNNVDNTYN